MLRTESDQLNKALLQELTPIANIMGSFIMAHETLSIVHTFL